MGYLMLIIFYSDRIALPAIPEKHSNNRSRAGSNSAFS